MLSHLVRAPLLCLLCTLPASAQDYVLNGQGADGRYKIYRVSSSDGYANPSLIVSPSLEGFDGAHVYWPSAVKVGDTTYLYATGADMDGNLSLGLWLSSDGSTFKKTGQVLKADEGEGQIGSAHVLYDAADKAAPFKMWYGTNYRPRSTVIKYATSLDGVIWKKHSVVLEAREAYETQGFQLDYVCRDRSAWRMWYSATNDPANRFEAVGAYSQSPGGQYQKQGVVFSPGGTSHRVLSTVTTGSRHLKLDTTEGLKEGGVYVLTNGQVSERVVVDKVVDDDEASIRDAMVSTGEGFVLRSAHYRKTGVSVFYRDAEEKGRALFTGWGALPEGALSEYVFEGYETGQGFAIDYDAPDRFKPPEHSALHSFENPSPIKSDPDC